MASSSSTSFWPFRFHFIVCQVSVVYLSVLSTVKHCLKIFWLWFRIGFSMLNCSSLKLSPRQLTRYEISQSQRRGQRRESRPPKRREEQTQQTSLQSAVTIPHAPIVYGAIIQFLSIRCFWSGAARQALVCRFQRLLCLTLSAADSGSECGLLHLLTQKCFTFIHSTGKTIFRNDTFQLRQFYVQNTIAASQYIMDDCIWIT